MNILAVDPGVTTGYCFAELHNLNHSTDIELKLRPVQHTDDVEEIWDRVEAFKPRYIICEDFEFRQRSRAGLVLFSVQAIGVIRLYEQKATHQVAVTLQKAAQGKGYYTDAQLKRLELYKRGVAHGMDATRHLLHWITFGAGYSLIEGKQISDIARLV